MLKIDQFPHDYAQLVKSYQQPDHTQNEPRQNVVRFAPSPTGHMHLGNIYSALYTQQAGHAINARILLRIEDIDPQRCRPDYTQQIHDDLKWIGIEVQGTARQQSDHLAYYHEKIDQLEDKGLAYPCFCTRKDLQKSWDIHEGALPTGPEGPLYLGTCRDLSKAQQAKLKEEGRPFALRLNISKSLAYLGQHQGVNVDDLQWVDLLQGPQKCQPHILGDVILARKDCGTSYHASVVLDDALQGITLITRGIDLWHSTHIHRVLQALWGFPTPLYDHHPLLMGEEDAILAKSMKSVSLKDLRQTHTKDQIMEWINKGEKTFDPTIKIQQLSAHNQGDHQ